MTVKAHTQAESGKWVENIPEHEDRKETAEFRHTKILLEQKLHEKFCAACFMEHWDGLVASGKLPKPAFNAPHTIDFDGVTVQVNLQTWYLHEAGRLGVVPEQSVDSHHFAIEWCFAPDASWDKVNLRAEFHDWYGLYALGKQQGRPPISDPDDDRTQLILCDLHHKNRNGGLSIHFEPDPVWSAQWVVKDGVVAVIPLEGYHPEGK